MYEEVTSLSGFVDRVEKADTCGVIVNYWADWCDPCEEIIKFLKTSVSKQYGTSLRVVSIDVTKNEDICERNGVETVPYLSYYRYHEGEQKQQCVAHTNGNDMVLIERNLTSLFGNGNDNRKSFPNLDDYISYLIKRDTIMLFITGSPSQPMCGFTGKLCALLDKYKASYSYYDIMADDELCQRLKVYSKWPTYPQVYVDGQLIGGLDVMLELESEGELKSALKL